VPPSAIPLGRAGGCEEGALMERGGGGGDKHRGILRVRKVLRDAGLVRACRQACQQDGQEGGRPPCQDLPPGQDKQGEHHAA
jgi:hypothetical protein